VLSLDETPTDLNSQESFIARCSKINAILPTTTNELQLQRRCGTKYDVTKRCERSGEGV
jgi:hypothetical protein